MWYALPYIIYPPSIQDVLACADRRRVHVGEWVRPAADARAGRVQALARGQEESDRGRKAHATEHREIEGGERVRSVVKVFASYRYT